MVSNEKLNLELTEDLQRSWPDDLYNYHYIFIFLQMTGNCKQFFMINFKFLTFISEI